MSSHFGHTIEPIHRSPGLTTRGSVAVVDPTEPVVSVSRSLKALRQAWWKIVLITVVSTLGAYFATKLFKPVYMATARLIVDDKTSTDLVGGQSGLTVDSDTDQVINTNVQMIQSDSTLRPVANHLHLLSGSDADSSANAPVALPQLRVSHIPNTRIIEISYRSHDPSLAAQAANEIARSYIQQEQDMRASYSFQLTGFMERQISDLKRTMASSTQNLAAQEKQLGVINPDQKTSILTARIQQLNTQLTDAQNERIRKEAEYKAILAGSASAIEASSDASALSALQERRRKAEEQLAVDRTTYGPSYAEYKRSANALAEVVRQESELREQLSQRIATEYREAQHREALLAASLAQAKGESDMLNAASFQYDQLRQEALANANLYSELYRKIKEAGINAGFQSNAIRVAQEATTPNLPVFPNKKLFAFLGFLVSFVASCVVILVRSEWSGALREPAEVYQATALPVIGTIPEVHGLRFACAQPQLEGRPSSKRDRERLIMLNFFRECLASMLTSLQSRYGLPPRTIAITSSEPGEGKSTCAAYLAIEYAAQGKKCLIIDADLRCPSLHTYFEMSNDGGVASIIDSDCSLQTIIRPVPNIPNLDLIVAGESDGRPSPLVGNRVLALVREARLEYDFVVVDAPPLLNLAEPIQIASGVDAVLLVAQSGRTTRKALSKAVTTLSRVRANVSGVVLNRMPISTRDVYNQYRAYRDYSRRWHSLEGGRP